MDKGWAISWTPRELSRKSSHLAVFYHVLRSNCTDFLLTRGEYLYCWEQLGHFHLGERCYIPNVVKCFDLFKMEKVVNHPQIVVIRHGNIQILPSFRSLSNLTNSTTYVQFSFHKPIVLWLDTVNNTFSMNIGSVWIKINLAHLRCSIVCSVIIVKETR